MNSPVKDSLWTRCFFEVAERAKAEGKTEISFDEVDALVLEKAKEPDEPSDLPARLRELAVELNWRSIQLASIAQRKDFDRWMARAEKILSLVEEMPGWADELEKED